MRPIIEAEERLETMTLHVAASGNMAKGEFEGYTRELRERIDARKPKVKAARPKTLEEVAKIGGIQVVEVAA